MKEALLLLLFFAPCLKSQNIPEIPINPNKTTPLSPSIAPDFFCIKASSKNSSSLILTFKAIGYKLKPPQYGYSSDRPTMDKSYEFKNIGSYTSVRVNSDQIFNCSIPVEGDKYIVVKYLGEGLDWLYATCYYVKTKLSTLAIVLIVVGSVIVVVVIIVIIYCVCKKRKSSVGVSNSNFPIMDQNSGNNPNYSNY